jgi:alpha-L-rhamnosidase
MDVTNLRCEYATNPIGLDIPTPQFSWEIRSTERGAGQTAYQVVVAASPEDLRSQSSLLWDSGRVVTRTSVGILYAGPELESRKRYYWLVRLWGSEPEAVAVSEAAYFEMGLLKPSDWQALWIGCPASWSGRVLYFRRAFSVEGRVSRARAYVSGLGYYVLYINGQRVGDHVLDPGTSDYSKRVLYATYDITGFLEGQNALGVMVGPGWYGIPKLRLQAEITYEDGRDQIVATCWDPWQNWLVTTGPTIRSSIFDGELYDARQEKPDWAMPHAALEGTSRSEQWINAVVTDAPGGEMVSQLQEPIKVVETLAPNIIRQPVPGVYVLDAGRNLAGWAAIKVRGAPGTRVSLKFAESLREDGTVNQENLRSAAAEDAYIFKGVGEEQWEPSFTYHGFRYIQVEGLPYGPGGDDILARVVRSAVEPTGKFACSNPLLNRIQQMVCATEASNLHSIPTDCPQRDERMGWLNDMTVRIEQALYNFDLSRFYQKWIADIKDTQSSDGAITDTAPFRWGFRPADPVSASYLLAVLKSYEFYGNRRMVSDHFNGLKAWVDYLATRTENGIVNYSYWGDWSPPEEFGTPGSVGSGAVSRNTPGKLISTGYLYYCARLLSQMAAILENKEDEVFYENLAKQTANAFNRTWWNETTGGYASNNQACNAFALFLGLVGCGDISRVVENLVKDVEKHNYHLTTGNLCTKYLLEILTEYGHPELAYKIVTQETYPSWGYMLANGATTLWERWENKTGGQMNSHNHPMMGSVGSWLYKYVAGILPDICGPGFEQFTIKPCIFDGLTFAQGEYSSVKGVIQSAWRKEPGLVYLDLTIPANSTATVYVPTTNRESITESNQSIAQLAELRFIKLEAKYAIFQVPSGRYCFKSDWYRE